MNKTISLNINKLDFKNKILFFIHIPKTAGSSLTSSKQIINLDHKYNVPGIYRTPSWKKGFNGYNTDTWGVYRYPSIKHYKITIVRNPFDLLCSYYFYGEKLKSDGSYCHSGWASVNYTHNFKSFKQFIKSYCDPDFKWHQPALKNFLYGQLFNTQHKCVADIIVKYEYLNDAIDLLNKKLFCKIKKTHINKSKRKDKSYKHYYDKEMIELVTKKCEKELKYFNYDFNGSTVYQPLFKTNLKYDVKNNKILN